MGGVLRSKGHYLEADLYIMNPEVDVRNVAIFKQLQFTTKHLVHYEHHYHYDNDFLLAFSH